MIPKTLTPEITPYKFEAIVQEAKNRIPAYIDGWTDHNLSDPGVTMIELFAWMTEMIAYQQNRIPERLHLRLLKMMGIEPSPPQAATTDVTFYLSKQLINPPDEQMNPEDIITIPQGTEVATTQTETQASIIFSTDSPLTIQPPELKTLFRHHGEPKERHDLDVPTMWVGNEKNPKPLFSTVPKADDALYFGFPQEQKLSHHLLFFEFDCVSGQGTEIHTNYPPYRWEAAAENENGQTVWRPCRVDLGNDETLGLNQSGKIIVQLPAMTAVPIKEDLDNRRLNWVRLRILHPDQYPKEFAMYMRPYGQTPHISRMRVGSIGGTTQATHAQTIHHEFLGYSDGSPGQTFQLQSFPLLEPQANETLVVRQPDFDNQGDAIETEWTWRKEGFASPELKGTHFALDLINGTVRLPPAILQPDGNVKLFGAIPERNASLYFKKYRHGGGAKGNVPANSLDTLKTAVPYVSKVRNHHAARNGRDMESLEATLLTAPGKLHAQQRAVTASDFEQLVSQAPGVAVGRVKCLQPSPHSKVVSKGDLFLLVLPKVSRPLEQRQRAKLYLAPDELDKIKAFIDERRLLTSRVEVRQPELVQVQVRVSLQIMLGADRHTIRQAAEERLYRLINPFTGGAGGGGWPFGKDLYPYDIYYCLQGLADVLNIAAVSLYVRQENGRLKKHKEKIVLQPYGLFISDLHEVQFQ